MASAPSPDGGCLAFDFRSDQFRSDARTLVRTTGLSLEACRQELFIAGGDMVLAFELLTVGYRADPGAPTLH